MEKHKNEYLIRLGSKVRERRIKSGLTQEQLAFNSGLDRSYVGGIERGERNISIITLIKLSNILGCAIHDLVRGIDNERERKN